MIAGPVDFAPGAIPQPYNNKLKQEINGGFEVKPGNLVANPAPFENQWRPYTYVKDLNILRKREEELK